MGWIWTGWLFVIVASFTVFEGYALKTGRKTLSRCTWDLFQAWPLIAVIFGIVFGGVAVHFFWHWCPPGSMSAG